MKVVLAPKEYFSISQFSSRAATWVEQIDSKTVKELHPLLAALNSRRDTIDGFVESWNTTHPNVPANSQGLLMVAEQASQLPPEKLREALEFISRTAKILSGLCALPNHIALDIGHSIFTEYENCVFVNSAPKQIATQIEKYHAEPPMLQEENSENLAVEDYICLSAALNVTLADIARGHKPIALLVDLANGSISSGECSKVLQRYYFSNFPTESHVNLWRFFRAHFHTSGDAIEVFQNLNEQYGQSLKMIIDRRKLIEKSKSVADMPQ